MYKHVTLNLPLYPYQMQWHSVCVCKSGFFSDLNIQCRLNRKCVQIIQTKLKLAKKNQIGKRGAPVAPTLSSLFEVFYIIIYEDSDKKKRNAVIRQ